MLRVCRHVVGVALFCGGALCWETDGKWLKGTQPPWKPHTGSLAVPISNGSVYLIAGQAGRHGGATFDCFNCTNEVWRFEPEEDVWANVTHDVPWDPRWGHSAVVTADDTIWMFFVCCERGKPTVMFRDIWKFNPVQGVPWTQVEAWPPFEGVQASSIAVLGDDIWVAGGWSQQRGTLSQVAVFSTKTLKWTVKSTHGEAPWRHRADHGSAISPDGRWLLIYAGQHRDNKTGHWFRLDDTWRVELPAARPSDWLQLGNLVGKRSSPALMVLPSGWLITLGGHIVDDDEQLKVSQMDTEGMMGHHNTVPFHAYRDVLALDLKNGGSSGWRVVEEQPVWPGRDDCASAAVGDDIMIFGGGTLYGGGGYHQDTWKLQAASKAYGLSEELQKDEL